MPTKLLGAGSANRQPMVIKDLIVSFMTGGAIYGVLMASNLIRAHSTFTSLDSLVIAALYPGVICGAGFVRAFSTFDPRSMGQMGLIFFLMTVIDVSLYSFVMFILVRVTRVLIFAPCGPSADAKPVKELVWRAPLAIPIGSAIAVALTGVWVFSGHWPGPGGPWFLPGFKAYALIFGYPSHSAGGLWLVCATALNTLFYSTLVFITKLEIDVWLRRR